MRYMQSFNRRLKQLRENRQLSRADLAELCGVEDALVAAWESADPKTRRYPGVAELMDICLRTDSSLDSLLDFGEAVDAGQLELPGLAFSNEGDLTESLSQLEKELNRLQLSDEERKLLHRFRKTSSENRRMVLQLLRR
ncbi:MAG: helix-turn-helix transcriptional regulator [Marinobacter sp.]|uniref:helix-turn-helix transcriptional regulator n=1 Tax=Marinobacter sp. TaxID=50741 RepID=UPI00299D09F8|nr:helix-turn-helix transcriptional regulator [Marinobacter sp.]MDX1634880.1 helix-turn-helix transcriptional regulator [Marinobacter sp.]